jgi:transposase
MPPNSRRAYSSATKQRIGRADPSRIGSRCVPSTSAASTSRCKLLHLEYKQAHPDGWGYTKFCRPYKRWLDRQDVVMRLEYAAGEWMFVDFAGDTMPVTDPETGEVWGAQMFVSVLGASGYLYPA